MKKILYGVMAVLFLMAETKAAVNPLQTATCVSGKFDKVVDGGTSTKFLKPMSFFLTKSFASSSQSYFTAGTVQFDVYAGGRYQKTLTVKIPYTSLSLDREFQVYEFGTGLVKGLVVTEQVRNEPSKTSTSSFIGRLTLAAGTEATLKIVGDRDFSVSLTGHVVAAMPCPSPSPK